MKPEAAAEPLILSVETATEGRSAAVLRGEIVLASRLFGARAAGASDVLAEIDAALRAAQVSLPEIDLFAAAAGPGSFTGLRAGLATIKAFSATLGRPACGVPTLHAVARSVGPAPRVLAALPAGRAELFAQLLSVAADGRVFELGAPAHVSPAALLDEAARAPGETLVWAGAGALSLAGQVGERARLEAIPLLEGFAVGEPSEGWALAPPPAALAEHVAALARAAYREGRVVGAEHLRAIYVRPSDAELNKAKG